MTNLERLRAARAEREAHLQREVTGEARGYRYAIACSVGWVGPWHLPGPHVHDDSCTHRDPVMYEGDRASANARANRHADSRRRGAMYHSPEVVPEEYIARCVAQKGWNR